MSIIQILSAPLSFGLPAMQRINTAMLPKGLAVLVCLFTMALCLYPGRARAWEPASVIWHSGDTIVHVLEDRPGSMDVALFSGPASAAQREAYFTQGKAPAAIGAFLVRKGGRAILVDTGFGDAVPGVSALLLQLASLNISPEKVDTVLLTHAHSDHAGGLLHEGQRVFPKARVLVCAAELDYWLGLNAKDANNANAALVRKVVDAYGDDIQTFSAGDEVLPLIGSIDASGHTPGHTAFRFKAEKGGDLLIAGDAIHAAALQFPLPEECASYDMDKEKAVAARKMLLSLAAQENLIFAGMHLPYPGAGKVSVQGKGFDLDLLRLTPQPQ